jgi:hypothetical protein
MEFTTLAHAYERCNVLDQDGALNVSPVVTREIARIIAGVSQRMSQCMNRDIQVKRRVETVAAPHGRVLFVDNPLIRSVISVEFDPTGLFSASNGASIFTAGSDYTVDPDGYRINMITPMPMSFRIPCKPYRVTYMGGHAYHVERTVYAVAAVTGTPDPAGSNLDPVRAGCYEQGDGSIFALNAYDGTAETVTFIADAGTFDTGDEILCSTTGAKITLGAVIEDSVTNNLPSLEGACLMQVQYEFERRLSVGKRSTTTGHGETSYVGEYGLLKEVAQRCDDYQLYSMAAT